MECCARRILQQTGSVTASPSGAGRRGYCQLYLYMRGAAARWHVAADSWRRRRRDMDSVAAKQCV